LVKIRSVELRTGENHGRDVLVPGIGPTFEKNC
jgi:hypothetical protein